MVTIGGVLMGVGAGIVGLVGVEDVEAWRKCGGTYRVDGEAGGSGVG